MKILIGTLLLLTVTVSGIYLGIARSTPPHKASPLSHQNSMIVRGSIPYWDQRTATETFTKNASKLNQVALFWYYLDRGGKVTKYEYAREDSSILALAHQNNIKSFFTLTNLGERAGETWDSKRVEEVIKDENSRSKHIEDIVTVFARLPFDGVSIDYEEVDASQRDNFSTFIKELAASLHQRGKLLNVALHPITDSKSEKRYYFQDFKTLSQSADYLTVMAFGEHYDEGSPGPIASNPWLIKIIDYLRLQKLPLQKIFLGIPLYGYDWTEDSSHPAQGLTYQDVQKRLVDFHPEQKWDEEAQSPSFKYTKEDQTHHVWFEDARSVDQKMSLAQEGGLGGVSFWRLGGEDPEIWAKIESSK